ncbi:hypothetical protein FRC11_005899 [Ceratobasidium sp. 423]|nr:hypothetical protein FRC11_005899 [Ceratobasidium sp. 423]
MKTSRIALMNALLQSTNPHELERLCYTYWNHILASRSNFNGSNHLLTSPEFPVVVPISETEVFDTSYYDEDEDDFDFEAGADSESSSSDGSGGVTDESIFHDPFFTQAGFEREISLRSTPERRKTRSTLNPQAAEPLSPSASNPSSTLYTLRPPRVSRERRNSINALQTHVAAPDFPSESAFDNTLPVTSPVRSTVNDDSFVNQEASEVAISAPGSGSLLLPVGRRARIVDFAVNHLVLSDNPIPGKFLGYTLSSFASVKVPIVVEGKRAPKLEFTDDLVMFHKHLRMLFILGDRDIGKKKHFFFQVYSCKSFIAIVFAGPYWTFSICWPGSRRIKWSKPIAGESKAHKSILRVIFQAAETNPDDPATHEGLRVLVDRYRQDGTFTIVH